MEAELESRRRERDAGDKQRRLQLQAIEQVLVEGGLVDRLGGPGPPVEQGTGTVSFDITSGSVSVPAIVSVSPKKISPSLSETHHGTTSMEAFHTQSTTTATASASALTMAGEIDREPVREMPPMEYSEVTAPPVTLEGDISSQLDYMAKLEVESRGKGESSPVKSSLALQYSYHYLNLIQFPSNPLICLSHLIIFCLPPFREHDDGGL